mgnify:CR=1 FL=1
MQAPAGTELFPWERSSELAGWQGPRVSWGEAHGAVNPGGERDEGTERRFTAWLWAFALGSVELASARPREGAPSASARVLVRGFHAENSLANAYRERDHKTGGTGRAPAVFGPSPPAEWAPLSAALAAPPGAPTELATGALRWVEREGALAWALYRALG